MGCPEGPSAPLAGVLGGSAPPSWVRKRLIRENAVTLIPLVVSVVKKSLTLLYIIFMKPESIDSGWRDFLALCAEIHDPAEFNRFFALFLTFEERETMASRYLIIQELLEGLLTQREIAEAHKISIAQITRGSNALKIVDPIFKNEVKKKMLAIKKKSRK